MREQSRAIAVLYLVTPDIDILSVVDNCFNCYYFTKLLEVPMGPCTRASFIRG